LSVQLLVKFINTAAYANFESSPDVSLAGSTPVNPTMSIFESIYDEFGANGQTENLCIGRPDVIRELLRSNERFAEIYEEYELANTAFLRWQKLDGARSPIALQYCDLMKEREQELLDLLKQVMPPDGD
jgi:hypothetical protein